MTDATDVPDWPFRIICARCGDTARPGPPREPDFVTYFCPECRWREAFTRRTLAYHQEQMTAQRTGELREDTRLVRSGALARGKTPSKT